MRKAVYRLDRWLGQLVSRLDGPIPSSPKVRWRPSPKEEPSEPAAPSESTAPELGPETDVPAKAAEPTTPPATAKTRKTRPSTTPADLEPALVQALSEVGEEGISMTELGRRLGVGRGALRPRLKALIDRGEAERVGAGLATRYRIRTG